MVGGNKWLVQRDERLQRKPGVKERKNMEKMAVEVKK